MLNEGKRRFILSWDLRENKKMKGDEFRTDFIKLLINYKCTNLKSYTNSCIYFTSRSEHTTKFWNDMIHQKYNQIVLFNISEVSKDESGIFEVYGWHLVEHLKKFLELVTNIKSKNQ